MNWKRWILLLVLIFLVFVFIFAVVRYGINIEFEREKSVLKRKDKGPEYVDSAYIVEAGEDALDVRLNMLDQARETVDISYYKILLSDSSQVFFSKIFETADRGVKIRVYLDGAVNSFNGEMKGLDYALMEHENIEYKLHEPLKLLKPWKYNARLHDKIMLVDGRMAILGGRNIGDRFFLPDRTNKKAVLDRDVLIYNEGKEKDSILRDIESYYNKLWSCEAAYCPFKAELDETSILKGEKARENIDRKTEALLKADKFKYSNINFTEISEPIKRLEFVHNSVDNWKNPVGLQGILELAEASNSNILVQSPYVILSRNMIRVMEEYDIAYNKLDIVTNSYYSSPNLMAVSGYNKYRKKIKGNVNNLYEYFAENSIHGKSYIFDDNIAVIGSFNMDPRSAYLSTEAYIVFYDENFTRLLKDNIDTIKSHSRKVNSEPKVKAEIKAENRLVYGTKILIIKMLSIIVYLFDYML